MHGFQFQTETIFAGGNKKDLYPRHDCLDKGLVDKIICPGSGSFDRIDGIRVDLFSGR